MRFTAFAMSMMLRATTNAFVIVRKLHRQTHSHDHEEVADQRRQKEHGHYDTDYDTVYGLHLVMFPAFLSDYYSQTIIYS